MKEFTEKYATQLEDIENALDESLSEAWDYTVDPIALSFRPYEQTNIIQLIKSDNKVFNKVMLVYSALCSEVNQLRQTVRL